MVSKSGLVLLTFDIWYLSKDFPACFDGIGNSKFLSTLLESAGFSYLNAWRVHLPLVLHSQPFIGALRAAGDAIGIGFVEVT